MCEVCNDPSENWSKLRPLGAEDLGCEFSTEEIPEACGAEACYESTERYVESHLCEEHMREPADLLGDVYTGRSMKVAHEGLRISEKNYDLLMQHAVAALDEVKVAEREKGDVLSFLANFKGDCVENR